MYAMHLLGSRQPCAREAQETPAVNCQQTGKLRYIGNMSANGIGPLCWQDIDVRATPERHVSGSPSECSPNAILHCRSVDEWRYRRRL